MEPGVSTLAFPVGSLRQRAVPGLVGGPREVAEAVAVVEGGVGLGLGCDAEVAGVAGAVPFWEL